MSWFTVLRLLLYRSVLELFSKSFKVFHCSVINVRCCYFQQLVYFIISSSRCQQLFESFYLIQSGEGGIWTLAPLLTTCTLSRGVPSASLGTSPNQFPIIKLEAERVGFEPTRPCGQTVFKTASLWPLRYLSILIRFKSAQKWFYHQIDSMSTIIFIFSKFQNISIWFPTDAGWFIFYEHTPLPGFPAFSINSAISKSSGVVILKLR